MLQLIEEFQKYCFFKFIYFGKIVGIPFMFKCF